MAAPVSSMGTCPYRLRQAICILARLASPRGKPEAMSSRDKTLCAEPPGLGQVMW